ncbi:MAG: ion channel [Xanthomonadales bacterium]|jgi:voltage-gated potassium channel Kch|nr:ion channel [Xanthomonadales bacterium]
MLFNLLVGLLMMVINLGIQVMAVSILIRFFIRRIDRARHGPDLVNDIKALSMTMAVLIAGHVFQFATWASLFLALGEFTSFATAFYHSTVNFTSLGYGDIVMSEQHRLLGALEAANGVLMFGLSAGLILTVLNNLFNRNENLAELKASLDSKK